MMNDSFNLPLCSGFGRSDTDKRGARLPSITLTEIFAMIDSPQSLAKESAQWVILSELHTRNNPKQLQSGSYHGVGLDLDESATLEQLMFFLAKLGCFYAIYSTKSATLARPRWRAVIPFAKPATAAEFNLIAVILNDRLDQSGIKPDRHNETPNQIFYLPNRGDHYQSHIENDLECLNWQLELSEEIKAKEVEAIAAKSQRVARQ